MRKHILLVMVLVLVLTIVSCNKQDKEPSATQTPQLTQEPTAVPTEGPTAEPKATLKPITNKGYPQEEAEVLIFEDFDDGEIDENEFVVVLGENADIIDGEMHITREWTALSPEYDYAIGTLHHQYEFSMEYYSTFGRLSAPHVAYWVGARVPPERYAAYPGGFWVAFTHTNIAFVYPGGDNFEGKEHWAEKCFQINVPEEFMTKHKITVVDTGDEIYYYMNTTDEEYYLILKAVLDGADLLLYDKDDNMFWAGENALNDEIGFSIFSHRQASHTDNVTLKGH
jgi:hypothetical protein